jgi:hypothetical protein
MRHACTKSRAPSSSVWSLSTMPSRRPPRSLAAVEFKQVEGVQHGLGDRAAPVERVEYRHAIRPAHHGLGVERERLGAQQGRGDGDRRVAAAPVVARGRPSRVRNALLSERTSGGLAAKRIVPSWRRRWQTQATTKPVDRLLRSSAVEPFAMRKGPMRPGVCSHSAVMQYSILIELPAGRAEALQVNGSDCAGGRQILLKSYSGAGSLYVGLLRHCGPRRNLRRTS